ncbi:MAG: DNA-3-methyladenine glycosylase I [Minisyncoccia bacterium]
MKRTNSPQRGKASKGACSWPREDPLMRRYHDREWGVPVTAERKIFEFLVLESAQAGLSWRTILYRRGGYRRAFASFNYKRVARFGRRDAARLLKDARIIRNRLKIEATINNAKRFLEVRKEFGTFAKYMWGFVGGHLRDGKRRREKDVPATSRESDAFAADLKRRGFKFLGSTVVYAHMQAVGMVNDHIKTCPRYKELKKRGTRVKI